MVQFNETVRGYAGQFGFRFEPTTVPRQLQSRLSALFELPEINQSVKNAIG
jgi:hypothetical protein